MLRDSRLLQKLSEITDAYLLKHKKFSPEARKAKTWSEATKDYFSTHGVKGYKRASDFQQTLLTFDSDEDALHYLYNQTCISGTALSGSKEFKKSLLNACAEFLKIEKINTEKFGYAIIKRWSGKDDQDIGFYVSNRLSDVRVVDLGLPGSPHAALSVEAYKRFILTKLVNEVYQRKYPKRENEVAPDCGL